MLGARVERKGQVFPVNEVFAHGVAPVLAGVFRRIGLIEQVPAPLPETESVGVVEPPFRIDVVVYGAMGVPGQLRPGSLEAEQQRIGFQLLQLLFQRGGECVLWNPGPVVVCRFFGPGGWGGAQQRHKRDSG